MTHKEKMKEAPIVEEWMPQGDQNEYLDKLQKNLGELQKKYGDIFVYLKKFELFHPKHVEHILYTHENNYQRDPRFIKLLAPTFGNDNILVTNDNNLWSHDRKLSDPFFDPHTYFDQYVKKICERAHRFFDKWESLLKDGSKKINIASEIGNFTIDTLNQTIFYKIDSDPEKLINYLNSALKNAIDLGNPFLSKEDLKKLAEHQQDVINKLTQLREDIVYRRFQENEDYDDLLGNYLDDYRKSKSKDESVLGHIARNVLTLDMAGFATTSTTLHWLFIFLHQHPQIEQALTEESSSVNIKNFSDLSKLRYIQATIFETLRLRPPVYNLFRQAIAEDELLGYRIPAKAGISLNTYFIHRHPDYWENPEKFDPERFIKKPLGQDYPYAYLPFGGGQRRCLGRNFAILEMSIVLALFVQRFRLSLEKEEKVGIDYRRLTLLTPTVEEMILHKK